MRLVRMKNRSATREAVAPVVEAMERRQLLSVSLDDGTLLVTGTRRGDSITVGLDAANPTRLNVVVNRAASSFSVADVDLLDVVTGSGGDRVVVHGGANPAFSVRVRTGNGNDSVRGTEGDDVIEGGRGLDLIVGGGGNDRLLGGSQADRILGGLGNDTILGGTGHDIINTGGQDADEVNGGPGNNKISTDRGLQPTSATWLAANIPAASAGAAEPMARPPGTGYSPQQIREAYGFGDLSDANFTNRGAGQTVAVVIAFDYEEARHDLQVFSNEFGLPAPSKQLFGRVYASGFRPLPDDQWSGEAALDIQWVHAIAPEAKIVLVHADSNLQEDLFYATERAAEIVRQAGGGVISMSWGSPGGESNGDVLMDRAFQRGDNTNVSFVAASGDFPSLRSHPATSPHVLSVGGTFLPLDAEGDRTGAETAWSASGGGISQVFERPSYQFGLTIGGKLHRVGRATPDIAYNADPASGVAVFHTSAFFQTGSWGAVGGTSASAPQIAGLIALANEQRADAGRNPLGSAIHSVLYSLGRTQPAPNFRDIVGGSNGKPALPGFDLATGWGVPHATVLIDNLARAPVPSDSADVAFTALFRKPSGSDLSVGQFQFGGSGTIFRRNPNELDLTLGSAADGIVADFDRSLLIRSNGAFRGTGRVTLATNSGLPLVLNLRITANFNKRGDLFGQFVAVTSKGKILRVLGEPVLVANFGPPV
jgi:hypothetical protein